MNTSRPLFTVLMTVRNGEPYVKAAVESVLSQTFEDFELLVVDNGSKDTTLETLSSFKDRRIRVHPRGEDLGRTSALNLGLELARGELVAILDADDIALPGRLEAQAGLLDASPETVLVGSAFAFIDEKDNRQETIRPPVSHDCILAAFPLYNPFAHSTVAFRKKDILAAGGYPSRYAYSQDFALYLALARGSRLAILPDVLGLIRRHSAQATLSGEYEARVLGESTELFRLARKLFPPDPDTLRKSLEFYGAWERRYIDILLTGKAKGRAVARVAQAILREPARKTSWSLVPRIFRRSAPAEGS